MNNRPGLSSHLPTIALLTTSLGLVVWYAVSEFIPELPFATLSLGFDPVRYHVFAVRNTSSSALDLLTTADASAFGQLGYPVLLSLLYGLTTPDPLIGCIANWLLWVGAGSLVAGLGDPRPGTLSRLPFTALWLLYPEAIAWCGATGKEPLVIFTIACAVRTCSSDMPRWAQGLLIAALAVGMYWVRSQTTPLVLLPLAISFEFRRDVPRVRGSRVLVLALIGVIGLYVAGQTRTEDDDTINPLALAGYDKLGESAPDALSRRSLLRQMGSPNRAMDVLYVPIRSIANILCPLYLGPTWWFENASGFLGFLSAGLCFLAVLAISLRLLDREPWTRTRAVLFGVVALGTMALGLSGIIHERYRSIVVAALLPLGLRSFREEVAAHGRRRLVLGGAVLPVFIFLLYRILRQLS